MSRRTRNKPAPALPSTLRKSASVPLVLAASAALTACGNSYQRDEYASFDDCMQDWGKASQCEPRQSGTTSSGGTRWRYYGPTYEDGHRDSYQRSVRGTSGLSSSHVSSNRSIGRSSVSRGGFGGSAHSGSSGG